MSRIQDLLDRMTLAEKLGQLTMLSGDYAVTGPVVLAGELAPAVRAGEVGSVLNLIGSEPVHALQRLAVEESRLGIPLLVGFDLLHGHRTLFPIPLAEAGLFDPDTWALTARESAIEAAADGIALTFAPMLDVARDPRWGRTAESPGEDAEVGARFAAAKVQGFQGTALCGADALAACAKHFCGYGAVLAGREYASVDVSDRTMLELYVPPFAAAIAAGTQLVMPAFTDLAGIPMTASTHWLRNVLRARLGFDGTVVSDYNAIAELVRHGVAADLAAAAALALQAGVDIDMMSDAYRRGLPLALERGLVSQAQIDQAVLRVLALKERLGLFADPYARGATAQSPAAVRERRKLARSVAARAVVMLRNERDALPLPGLRSIAVLGPLADAAREMGGPWAAAAAGEPHVSVLEGLAAALPHVELLHAPGVEIEGDSSAGIAPALALCDRAELVLLVLGESASMSGEAASRAKPGLPGRQRALAQAVLERAHGAGKRVVLILFCGRPLIEPGLFERADAVLVAWFLGTEAGHALAELLTGKRSPSGRTAISWPRVGGQIPVFFGQRPGGRPYGADDRFTSRYLDVGNAPAYAFGHGLTYGRFRLGEPQLDRTRAGPRDSVEIRIEVVNEGRHGAEETVFLFAHDPLASVSRPLLELKGWAKIRLGPGERGSVVLRLAASALRFLGPALEPVFEPGEVELLVGPCADRAQLLAARLELTG